MPEGPAYWPDVAGGTVIADGGFYFNGTMFDGGRVLPLEISRPGSGSTLRTMGKTSVQQVYWLGGNQPASIPDAPASSGATIQLTVEVDYWAIREVAELGVIVPVWFDWPMTDLWYVPGGDGTVTEWRTARPLPYGLVSGISQATRPPKVWVDAASQTVNATGSASSGVVVLPDSDGYENLETIALDVDTYTWIKLRYHPMMNVRIDSVSEALIRHNEIVFEIEFEEYFGGIYTIAEGGGGGP